MLLITEILQKASDAKTQMEKMNILRTNLSEPLEIILQYSLSEQLEIDLPKGTPPYNRQDDMPIGHSPSNLYKEARKLYLFLKGYAPNLNKLKKEVMFIQILEGIHHTEADLLLAMKDKTFTNLYPGLSYELIHDTIPNLLPHPSTRTIFHTANKQYVYGEAEEVDKPKNRRGWIKGLKRGVGKGIKKTIEELLVEQGYIIPDNIDEITHVDQLQRVEGFVAKSEDTDIEEEDSEE